jgi:hypothetical protein
MNSFFIKTRSFFGKVFSKPKKMVVFPQEEEFDLFIGV